MKVLMTVLIATLVTTALEFFVLTPFTWWVAFLPLLMYVGVAIMLLVAISIIFFITVVVKTTIDNIEKKK